MFADADPFVDPATLYAALFGEGNRTAALDDFVKKHSFFDEIKGNTMVLAKLKVFLEADAALKAAESWHKHYAKYKWPFAAWRESKENLARLDKQLGEAFNELEMIRKLALPENTLLMFQRYELTLHNRNRRSRQSRR